MTSHHDDRPADFRETLERRLAALSPERRELLAQLLRERGMDGAPGTALARRAGLGPAPLSYAQERLWLVEQIDPGTAAYVIASAVSLAPQVDVAALTRALNEIVRRHEILRTTFHAEDGRPSQLVAPSLVLPLPHVDLRGDTRARAEADRLAAEEASRGFELGRGPLIRATLVRLDDEDRLLLSMHHIVSDGWSMGVLFRELSALYDAFSHGRPSPLSELPIQYADFAVWQRAQLRGPVLEQQLAYWRQALRGAPSSLHLPQDRSRPAVQTFRGATEQIAIDNALIDRLRAVSRDERVTLFMTLLAALTVVLHRLSGDRDIVVGSPTANRNRAEIEPLIGFFVNMLPLRVNLSGNPTVRELLRRARETAVGAFSHQDLPFERLIQELQPPRDPSRTPIFQVFFNHYADQTRPEDVSSSLAPESWSKFDLTLYAAEGRRTLDLLLVYNVDLFDASRMSELLRQFECVLDQFVEDPGRTVGSLSLVTARARAVLPDPAARLDDGWVGSVPALFGARARELPAAVAAVGDGESWTYGRLSAAVERLAALLRSQGVGRHDVVAIHAHRSTELAIAVLGALQAGAAFLLLDPAYPPSRRAEHLQSANPRGWIEIAAAGPVEAQLRTFVDAHCCARIRLEPGGPAEPYGVAATRTDAPEPDIGPDDLAVVAFTSGSSGRPKGILGRHGPLTHFLPWMAREFGIGPGDRFTMLSGLSHDPLQRDLFTPLCLGATLCVPSADDLSTPARLAGWMHQNGITIANLTPAMGQFLSEAAGAAAVPLEDLRYLFFVGESLLRRDLVRLRMIAPHASFVNLYGATETQRALGCYVVSAADLADGNVREALPLGKGMPDVQLLVLGESMQMAGIGELGDIYVRSPHLAAGYLADDELTRERFVQDPASLRRTDRLYKTGDRGHYLPDGNVQFSGRLDGQVNVRGFRVEVEEVRAVLARHPAVAAVAVVGRDAPDGASLVAYVVPVGIPPTVSELRRFAREQLPAYMIPSAVVTLDRLPITPNGKLDVAALPSATSERPELSDEFTPPFGLIETGLATIWCELLGLDRVGRHDNFFELGGHSLLATRLVSRLRAALGIEWPLRRLFEAPTIAELAAGIEASDAVAASTPPIKRLPRELRRIAGRPGGAS